MAELPKVTRQLAVFVAKKMYGVKNEQWRALSKSDRGKMVKTAQRALKAERRFLSKKGVS